MTALTLIENCCVVVGLISLSLHCSCCNAFRAVVDRRCFVLFLLLLCLLRLFFVVLRRFPNGTVVLFCTTILFCSYNSDTPVDTGPDIPHVLLAYDLSTPTMVDNSTSFSFSPALYRRDGRLTGQTTVCDCERECLTLPIRI